LGDNRSNRQRGGLALLFAALAIFGAMRSHGTPAIISGVAGGALIVIAIVLFTRKQ